MPMPQNPEVTSEFHPFLKEGMNEVEYFASNEVSARHKQLIKNSQSLLRRTVGHKNTSVKLKKAENQYITQILELADKSLTN